MKNKIKYKKLISALLFMLSIISINSLVIAVYYEYIVLSVILIIISILLPYISGVEFGSIVTEKHINNILKDYIKISVKQTLEHELLNLKCNKEKEEIIYKRVNKIIDNEFDNYLDIK